MASPAIDRTDPDEQCAAEIEGVIGGRSNDTDRRKTARVDLLDTRHEREPDADIVGRSDDLVIAVAAGDAVGAFLDADVENVIAALAVQNIVPEASKKDIVAGVAGQDIPPALPDKRPVFGGWSHKGVAAFGPCKCRHRETLRNVGDN